MYSHETQIRVRYGETDQMGYLYYGHYAQYYEVGRVETIRSLGITYKELEEKYSIWLPVVSLEVRYLRPAFYDDLLRVRCEIRELPETHIRFYTEIYNEQDVLINSGVVRLRFFDGKNKKVTTAPELVLAPLRPYFPTP